MYYFDNAATTRVRPAAAQRAREMMERVYANPSSLHSMGREAAQALALARRDVADAIGAGEGTVLFTSGGTEADNHAIRAALGINRRVGRHIVANAAEHPAVLEPLAALAAEGYEITYLRPGRDGTLGADAVAAALRDDTALVCVMLVNNETGAVNPVPEIRRAVANRGGGALIVCDAVQALFKIPFRAAQLGADFTVFSGHKIHAPKGAGALYIRPGLTPAPFIYGGGQESGLRSGTEALPAIAAFGEAAREGAGLAQDERRKVAKLRELFEQRLAREVPAAGINFKGGVPHIASVRLSGCPAEVTARILSDMGVYVSPGSACARGRRSHALMACGLSAAQTDQTIRVSFSAMNEPHEIAALCAALAAVSAKVTGRRDAR